MTITCLSCPLSYKRSPTKRTTTTQFCPVARREVDASSRPCRLHPLINRPEVIIKQIEEYLL
jgi:hypothetical protein